MQHNSINIFFVTCCKFQKASTIFWRTTTAIRSCRFRDGPLHVQTLYFNGTLSDQSQDHLPTPLIATQTPPKPFDFLIRRVTSHCERRNLTFFDSILLNLSTVAVSNRFNRLNPLEEPVAPPTPSRPALSHREESRYHLLQVFTDHIFLRTPTTAPSSIRLATKPRKYSRKHKLLQDHFWVPIWKNNLWAAVLEIHWKANLPARVPWNWSCNITSTEMHGLQT